MGQARERQEKGTSCWKFDVRLDLHGQVVAALLESLRGANLRFPDASKCYAVPCYAMLCYAMLCYVFQHLPPLPCACQSRTPHCLRRGSWPTPGPHPWSSPCMGRMDWSRPRWKSSLRAWRSATKQDFLMREKPCSLWGSGPSRWR